MLRARATHHDTAAGGHYVQCKVCRWMIAWIAWRYREIHRMWCKYSAGSVRHNIVCEWIHVQAGCKTR